MVFLSIAVENTNPAECRSIPTSPASEPHDLPCHIPMALGRSIKDMQLFDFAMSTDAIKQWAHMGVCSGRDCHKELTSDRDVARRSVAITTDDTYAASDRNKEICVSLD